MYIYRKREIYTMIFLKWNRLNRNCSGCVYCREIMNIASECPLKTIYATFFTFWVVVSWETTIFIENTCRIFSFNFFSYNFFFPLPTHSQTWTSHFEVLRGVLVSLITLSVAVITCSKTLSTPSVALTTPSEALPQLDPHPLKFFHTLKGSC